MTTGAALHSNLLGVGLCLLWAGACGPSAVVPTWRAEEVVRVGAGAYVTRLPPGELPPSDAQGKPAVPWVSADFGQVPTTHEWWSSLLWKFGREGPNPYSEDLHPHPLTMRARADGVELGYAERPELQPVAYFFPHRAELILGVEGLKAADARVTSYGDWTVTAELADRERSLQFTAGHGLPFVYARVRGGRARIELSGGDLSAAAYHRDGAVLGLRVAGHAFGVFAPSGSTWNVNSHAATSDLAGADYLSIALLPDDRLETLQRYQRHAYAFVTGSRVEYEYLSKRGEVQTRFELKVEHVEGARSAEPLVALYPHQWRYLDAPLGELSYVSPRGRMRVHEGRSFTTRMPLPGLLPALPAVKAHDPDDLAAWLALVANDVPLKPGLEGGRDIYWDGKGLTRLATAAHLAAQVSVPLRERLVQHLKEGLEDWFDGTFPRLFYYDHGWRTLYGVPSQYFSGSQLNDHHFVSGYFVYAAATVARFDPAWAKRYAPFVELLIRDAANWDRGDRRFPFLRSFDTYAGHSWASGTQFFDHGLSQESSGEDLQFAAAVALWGDALSDPALIELGAFLYATLCATIPEYWFDVHKGAYPEGYVHPTVGVLWGAGGVYSSWFGDLPLQAHGIQLMPTWTILHLSRYPQAMRENLRHLRGEQGLDPHLWRDVFGMFESLFDGPRAVERFEVEHYFEPEPGHSIAQYYHFVNGMAALGPMSRELTSDCLTCAAFEQGTVRSYVGYNGSTRPRTVRFSDGFAMQLEPGGLSRATQTVARGQAQRAP